VTIRDKLTGKKEKVSVRVWNDTVANLGSISQNSISAEKFWDKLFKF
jgi:hypothetical protein